MKICRFTYSRCLYYLLSLTLVAILGCPPKVQIKELEVVKEVKVPVEEEDDEKSKNVLLPERDEEPSEKIGIEEDIPTETPPQENRLTDIYFEYDKFNLTRGARKILDDNAKILLDNPDISIQIEGHCDERGSEGYNLSLGEKRALSARAYLETLGVSPDRLKSISYGEERPADPRHNEEAWAKNRRVHFLDISR